MPNLPIPNKTLDIPRAERDRYRSALEQIASCEMRTSGTVVHIARVALGGSNA